MALPEQTIAMGYLERETASSLVDSKRFVMFDEDKGKSASLEDVKDHILGDMSNTVENNTTLIEQILLRMPDFATELEVDEEGLVYLLNNGRRIAGPYGPFAGGGGGGGGSSNNAILTLMNTSGWLSKTIAEGANCPISFAWSSTEDDIPTGNGILVVRINNVIRINKSITQGRVDIDIGEYLSSGTNSVKVTISDVYSNSKSINYMISTISLTISSSFDATTPKTGAFTFSYIPTGNIQKTVYFIIDNGERVDTFITSVSNKQQNQSIPALSHGAHSLLVYFEAEVDGSIIKSNELYYDIIYVEQGNTTPIIASNFRADVVDQYTTLEIPFIVYNPTTQFSEVKIYVNNELKTSLSVGRTRTVWTYRADMVGSICIKIQSGLIYKEFNFTVVPSEVIAKITTEDLVLSLESAGRSNAEENPGTWTYNNINCRFDNFNYVSNGWIIEGGNTVLRINGTARLTIPYKPFMEEALHTVGDTGKTIEIDFATRDVLNYDATIISCMNNDRGFALTTQKAILKSAQSSVSTQYKENEHVRISFVIDKRTANKYGNNYYPLFYIYINGILSGVVQYPPNDDFSQLIPADITIGSNECTTDIYSIRIYDNSLTRQQILENWIADTQDVALMLQRYEHNNLYNEYGDISLDKLPNDLPYLIISGSVLPQKKGDKKTIDGMYVDPSNPSKSFTFADASIDVQGTSSQFYARKNYKIKFSNGFNMTQSGESVAKYAINDGIPTKTFTFKADVASSEGANNVELVRLYNMACPYKTPPQRDESNPLHSKIRQGIDGFPIVIFWDDGNTTSFLGKYNWNNDKGTSEVFGFIEGDESWETLNNSGGYALWKDADYTKTYIDSDGKVQILWLQDFEARYPDTDPAYIDSTKLSALSEWLVSTNQATATNNALDNEYIDIDGNTHIIDNAAYRLAKFRTEVSDHFEMDSVLFMYLFTELFLMVDSRAKNAFPSFFGDDKWCFLPYDMDTAIGIDNRGELTFGYSLEDIDSINEEDGGTAPVFNGQDSVLWINIRDGFRDELQTMYQNLRNGDFINYDNVESMFETHQSKWPEAIFNEDAWFKYIEPLFENGNSTYLPMALGSKSEQRKWWLYNRFRYLDSKYSAGATSVDTIKMRPGAIPENIADRKVVITPYADIYAGVSWDINRITKERATHGVPVDILCPLQQVGDNVVNILNASQLASVGDLSEFKPRSIDFSDAIRIQSVKVGSNVTGFTNPNLTDITFGNNSLLKTVDLRNCINLNKNVDLRNAINIENVYLENTQIPGVTLPNGGVLKVLHLPETTNDLTISNQPYITDLSLPSYEQITTLVLENVPTVDTLTILNTIDENKAKIRLTGFTWEVYSIEEIDEIFNRLDEFKILGGLSEADDQGIRRSISLEQAIQGTIRVVPDTITLNGKDVAAYHAKYPYITIEAEHRVCTVTYLKANGEILEERTVLDGYHDDYAGRPSKNSTSQFTYTFAGWSEVNNNIVDPNAQLFIMMDKTLYPCYIVTTRSYTATFIRSQEDGGGVLDVQQNILYGETPVYGGTTPQKDVVNPEDWPFYDWSPKLGPITRNMTYTAVFKDTSPITRILLARRPLEASGPMSYIGSFAFGYCVQLNTIDFPNVTSTSDSAFYACSSLTTMNLPNLTTIGSYTFASCHSLIDVDFSKVTLIHNDAFRDCFGLTTISFPLLEVIPSYAFANCSGLTSINLPNVTSISFYGFGNCGLSSITLSNVTTVGDYGFYNCNSLITVDFPNVTSINNYTFGGCDILSDLRLPLVTHIGQQAFTLCSQLSNVNLSRVQVISESAFASCSNLHTVSFRALTTIGSEAFADCTYLRSVYLLGPSVVQLANSNAFASTLIASGLGTIYVPSSLVSIYQGSRIWGPYKTCISGI